MDELIVASDHRRLGIGRRLMALSETHYRAEGFDGMQLVVVQENVPARTLYDALGYQVVQHRLRMSKHF